MKMKQIEKRVLRFFLLDIQSWIFATRKGVLSMRSHVTVAKDEGRLFTLPNHSLYSSEMGWMLSAISLTTRRLEETMHATRLRNTDTKLERLCLRKLVKGGAPPSLIIYI